MVNPSFRRTLRIKPRKAGEFAVCARHGTERARWKSSRQVKAEPKARRRARASPRGGVWRKPNPKARGDEQEPDTRCGTSGTSRHVTAKSSIRGMGVLYKSGVYVRKVTTLTPGDLPDCAQALGAGEPSPNGRQESAEGIVVGGSQACTPTT